MHYAAPHWLPGGNLQTIWPALFARRVYGPVPQYHRERWSTPDNDFIDVDWLENIVAADTASVRKFPGNQTLMVMFHGLEGSSRSHYSEAFADFARVQGMRFAIPHFRGCSGEINLAPRAYHSGDYEEVDWILRRFRSVHGGPIIVVGISLGGNMLLRWAEEMGRAAAQVVDGIAAVSAPVDLAAGGSAIGRGFNRLTYTRMFLNSMKPRALQRLALHPGLFNRQALQDAKNLYEFDNVFTAPLHGFKDTEDYWLQCSSRPHLHLIQIPTLIVNALNDPFVPAWSLPKPGEVGRQVTLWQPEHGGHVGFPQGRLPGHVRALPDAVGGWLTGHIG